MRCSIAASLTRKARAICVTVRPETMRSASAICCVAGRSGWQQMNSSRSTRRDNGSCRAARPCRLRHRRDRRSRHRRGSGSLRAASAHVVERGIAADQDEPGCRIARRPVLRPAFQRAQAGFLECFLRRVEIAEIAQQRAHACGRADLSAASIQAISLTRLFPAARTGAPDGSRIRLLLAPDLPGKLAGDLERRSQSTT